MILIVGDGNFSYSLSLVRNLAPFSRKNVIATSFEDKDTCIGKYCEKARSNLLALTELGSLVLHGIDATRLQRYPAISGTHKFEQVIFNFPHTGRKANIKLNRALLSKFFESVSEILKDDGKVEVTLCAGQGGTPKDSKQREKCNHWQIIDMATYGGFILQDVHNFVPVDGYVSTGKRGAGNNFITEGARTHTFVKSSPPPNLSDDWLSCPLHDDTALLPSSLGRRLPQESGAPRLPQMHFFKNICDKLDSLCDSPYNPNLSALLQNHLQRTNIVQLDVQQIHECPTCTKQFTEQTYSFHSQQNTLLAVLRPSLVLEFRFVIENLQHLQEAVMFCAANPVFIKPTANQFSNLHFEMMIVGKNNAGQNTQALANCNVLNILSTLFDERNLPSCTYLKTVCWEKCNSCEHLHLCNGKLPRETFLASNIHSGLISLLHLAGDCKMMSLQLICSDTNPEEKSLAMGYTCSFIDKNNTYMFMTILDMDILSCLLIDGLDTNNQRVLWSLCEETQARLFNACSHNIPYKSNSLYPPTYVLHISFWILDSVACDTSTIVDEKRVGFTEEKLLEILSHTCDDLLKDVKLVDKYVEPPTNSPARTSLCYEMVYSSHDFCLSKSHALKLQELVRANISKYLKVLVR